MSNDIQTGKLPVNLTSSGSNRNAKVSGQASGTEKASDKLHATDKVSVTETASRLQEIETMLGTIPAVNNTLVSEISQMIADGSLEIDLDRTAAKLIENETGVTDPDQ